MPLETIWKNAVLDEVKQKINMFKQRRQLLRDQTVKQYLDDLRNKFIIVTMDKPANNFAFIFLFSEVSAPNGNNPTYNFINRNHVDIISDNLVLCEEFGLGTTDVVRCLSIIIGYQRFIQSCIGYQRCIKILMMQDSSLDQPNVALNRYPKR